MKNPLTPAGIKPATFRFVAQHLNHCATAVPPPPGLYYCIKIDLKELVWETGWGWTGLGWLRIETNGGLL